MKQNSMSTTEAAISLQPQNASSSSLGKDTQNKYYEKKTYTVDEAISAIGTGTFQYKILIVTGLLWAADAVEIMRLSFLIPILKDEWNLTDGVDGTIGAVVFAGMLCGNIFWSNFSDRFGRRWAVIGSNFSQLFFGVLSAASPEIYSMISLRFLTGFCLGGSSCGFVLYAEFAPKNDRGKLLILQQSFWAFGCTLNALIAWLTLELLNWRWYIVISNIPMLFILFFAYNMPESVRWLVTINKIEKAQEILIKAAKENNGTNEPIFGDEFILESLESTGANTGNFREIFGWQYFRTTVLLINIIFLITFGYYGISFLSENFFDEITKSGPDHDTDKYWKVAITTSSEIPGILIALFTIDKYGRKNSMIANFVVFTICMFALMSNGIQESTGLSVSLVFFARMCASIEFLCIYIYFTEYYPTQIRNSAVGFGAACARIAGMITTYISQLDDITYAFYLYAISGVAGAICTLMLRGDTYGNDLTAKSGLLLKQENETETDKEDKI